MRIGTTRMQQLVTYGLSESEARVYLALLQVPSLGASTLAKVTSIPRSHLYEILESLQSEGLIDVLLLGSARAYRARPLHEYLERRLHEQRGRVAQMEASLEEARGAFVPLPEGAPGSEEAGAFRMLLGRRAVAREIDRMLGEPGARVIVLSSDKGAQRVIHHLQGVPPPGEGPSAFEVYLPRHAESAGTHHRLPDHVLDGVRWHDFSIPLLCVALEGREALWVQPNPDNEQPRAGKDTALHSTSPGFLGAYLTLLRAATVQARKVAAAGASP